MTLGRHLKLIHLIAVAYWQKEIQYRLGAMLWIFSGLITPLITMSLWLIVNQYSSLGINQSQIISYFFLSILVYRLTQSWVAEDLTYAIKSGRFSIYLIRPLSFIHERLAKDQATRGLRLVSLLPVFLIMLLILNSQLSYNLSFSRLFFFICALCLGYCLNFCISVWVGISTFWLEDAYGAFLLLMLVTEIFSGALIPLKLMPPIIAKITVLLPFYSVLGFPVDILTGTVSFSFIISYLIVIFFWLLTVFTGTALTYRKAIKNYTAQGI